MGSRPHRGLPGHRGNRGAIRRGRRRRASRSHSVRPPGHRSWSRGQGDAVTSVGAATPGRGAGVQHRCALAEHVELGDRHAAVDGQLADPDPAEQLEGASLDAQGPYVVVGPAAASATRTSTPRRASSTAVVSLRGPPRSRRPGPSSRVADLGGMRGERAVGAPGLGDPELGDEQEHGSDRFIAGAVGTRQVDVHPE